MHIETGDLVSGTVVRSLRQTPRTRLETFRMRLAGFAVESRDGPDDDETIVGVFAFSGVAGQPILLWDGPVPAATESDVASFFRGNTESVVAPTRIAIDVTTAIPLPDDDFWPIIDGLGGRMWQSTIDAAARALAARGDEFSRRWAQTAALKALPLADRLAEAGVAAGDQLHVIGATMGNGAEAYDRVLNDLDAFNGDWLSDSSSQVVWLGAHALDRLAPRDVSVTVETAFSDRHREIRARDDEDGERYRILHGFPPEERGPHFRIARTVATDEHGFRERLFIFDADGVDERDTDSVRHIADSFGGETVAGPEFSMGGGLGGIFNFEVFHIKRRSTVHATEYLRRYSTTPDAP